MAWWPLRARQFACRERQLTAPGAIAWSSRRLGMKRSVLAAISKRQGCFTLPSKGILSQSTKEKFSSAIGGENLLRPTSSCFGVPKSAGNAGPSNSASRSSTSACRRRSRWRISWRGFSEQPGSQRMRRMRPSPSRAKWWRSGGGGEDLRHSPAMREETRAGGQPRTTGETKRIRLTFRLTSLV